MLPASKRLRASAITAGFLATLPRVPIASPRALPSKVSSLALGSQPNASRTGEKMSFAKAAIFGVCSGVKTRFSISIAAATVSKDATSLKGAALRASSSKLAHVIWPAKRAAHASSNMFARSTFSSSPNRAAIADDSAAP